MDDEEQRDDDADCHSNFNAPADGEGENKEHESKVDPRSHPADEQIIKRTTTNRENTLTSNNIPDFPASQ